MTSRAPFDLTLRLLWHLYAGTPERDSVCGTKRFSQGLSSLHITKGRKESEAHIDYLRIVAIFRALCKGINDA